MNTFTVDIDWTPAQNVDTHTKNQTLKLKKPHNQKIAQFVFNYVFYQPLVHVPTVQEAKVPRVYTEAGALNETRSSLKTLNPKP